jgi:hypothetical protein
MKVTAATDASPDLHELASFQQGVGFWQLLRSEIIKERRPRSHDRLASARRAEAASLKVSSDVGLAILVRIARRVRIVD